LIARRVRELQIYCEIVPFNHLPDNINTFKAVIFSGSPFSVHQKDAPQIDTSLFRGKIPLLGVCYGAQYLAQTMGVSVTASKIIEYGRANLSFIENGKTLFDGISDKSQVWMSHGDTIETCGGGSVRCMMAEVFLPRV
jgi:GMP synthase (glutamine-hydrolysing)